MYNWRKEDCDNPGLIGRYSEVMKDELNSVKIYFNNQLNAQILLFNNNMYVTLQSSTCFEH